MALNLKPFQALSAGVGLLALGVASGSIVMSLIGTEKTKVFLKVEPDNGPDDCKIVVSPPEAWMWTDKSKNDDKPRKVQWRLDKSQHDDYYWAFSSANNFDNVVIGSIACGSRKKKGKKTATSGYIDYEIKVYECPFDKNDPVLVCEKDPRVRIQD